MNKRFEILNNFKGFGEPKNSIWFIGIEEGGEWNDRLLNDYKKGIMYNTDDDKNTSTVYQIISKIMVQLPLNNFQLDDWKEYRDKKLFRQGEPVFQTNLYPLGNPSVNRWAESYKELFGFGKEDKEEYLSIVKQYRFPMLYKFWLKNSPKLTICFGSTFWNEFIQLLNIHDEKYEKEDEGYFRIYSEKQIILTPFFSYRPHCMESNRIENLITVIKNYELITE